MNRRIAVTGIGVVTPLGTGPEAFAERLCLGESGIDEIRAFDTGSFSSHLGAEVKGFSPRDHISLKNLRKMDRLSSLVTAAARMALDDAGIAVQEANRDRIGICLGTAYGPTDVTVQFARTLFTDGPSFVNPILVPNTVMNAPAGHASIELGFRGPNATVNHYATSAETAIAYGAADIRRGAADVILTGGGDILSPFFFESLVRFRALASREAGTEKARPFDRDRSGPVAGEGCGIVCLEALDQALARGARPYCEITGWGLSSAPAPVTGWPSGPEGAILAMERAMAMAGTDALAIDLIQATANGGLKLDEIETEACRRLFGQGAERPLITSVKGALGESFSSGGIRAAALAQSIRQGRVPPTLGLDHPQAPLAFVTGACREAAIRQALLNGISHGGTFAAVIFKGMET